jgi:hypothetical protein
MMELNASYDIEEPCSTQKMLEHELWPLDPIDAKNSKFPCCLVWNPLPVVSWLAPFIGHVGICREDGTVLDFSGSYCVNVDDFAFGPVARYLELDRKQVLFYSNLPFLYPAALGLFRLFTFFQEIAFIKSNICMLCYSFMLKTFLLVGDGIFGSW